MRPLSKSWCRAVAILAAVFVTAPVASSSSGSVIGYLKWEILETATSRILDHGAGPVYLRDVVFRDFNAQYRRFTPKSIRLNRQFAIEMSEFPSAAAIEKSGFGMVGQRSGVPSFSWEWFTIADREHAVKLQESGELAIRLDPVDSWWEITRMNFTTDISLRVILEDLDSWGTPRWRINIAKGSYVTWPSWINGKVVPN